MSEPEGFERLHGRTILVTGAGGFLGSHIVQRLAKMPCTIRRLHRGSRPMPAIPQDSIARVDDVVGDVRELPTWITAAAGVDIVVHLAGQTSVYVATENPEADLMANVRPVLHLMQACRTLENRPMVVFSGTATQVGLTTSSEPVNESHPDEPITIYDLHKWMAEKYLETATREGLLSATTLRLANVYGPGPTAGSPDRGFLNAMIRRALAGEVLTMYGSGSYVRDYVFVDDVARAFLAAAVSPETAGGAHFIVGSGQGHTIANALESVASRVAARTARPVAIDSVEPPSTLSRIEHRNFVADTRRLQAATGWRPAVSLAAGIDLTIDAMLMAQKGAQA
jgi:UDP-glucose 4-epimerase